METAPLQVYRRAPKEPIWPHHSGDWNALAEGLARRLGVPSAAIWEPKSRETAPLQVSLHDLCTLVPFDPFDRFDRIGPIDPSDRISEIKGSEL